MVLKGAINFRDLGGTKTEDGRAVRSGHFYRSGALSRLTSEDCSLLSSLAIRHVIDYRDQVESQREKNIIWEGVVYESCPANPKEYVSDSMPHDFFSEAHLSSMPKDFMENLYRLLPFNNSAYKLLFQRVENLQDGAILQHCAVGKDRTGVGSALLLMALGVTKKTLIEEYLRTQTGLQPFRDELLKRIETQLSAKSLERLHYVMSAHENFIGSALAEIQKKYATTEQYLSAEFGLSPERIKILRDRFLE